MTTDLATQFPWTTAEDSILEKDWACGSKQQADTSEFVIRYDSATGIHRAEYTTVRYSPAWWKIIDEIIVNACDHFIRMLGSKHPVTVITISIDSTGHVRVYNDGPGVPVAIHPESLAREGRELYIPTVVFGRVFQGSNRVQADDSIVGGTNGMGAKIMQLFSSTSAVETVDIDERGAAKTYFVQHWHDHKSREDPPTVVPIGGPANAATRKRLGDKAIPHTLLSFMPDYKGTFGYKSGFDPVANADLVDIIRTRAWFAAAYIGYTVATTRGSKPCVVKFNDMPVPCKSIADIAALMFPGCPTHTATITPTILKLPQYKYPWEVCVVITGQSYEQRHLSNVNGIVVNAGKHIDKIMDMITEEARTRTLKALTSHNIKFIPSMVASNVFVLLNTKVPKPAWTGQRKDILGTDKRLFAGYTLESAFVGKITSNIEAAVLAHLLNKPVPKSRQAAPAGESDRYKPASGCRKNPAACRLLLVEGKSAKTQVTTGITSTIGVTNNGVMSTGGVFPNAHRECEVTRIDGRKHVRASKMFAGNEFIKEFLAATGLSIHYDYDPASPTYKREMAALYYHHVTACVDQDLDGKGCILGLLIAMFMTLWPKLIDAGYLEWFATPIMRATPVTGKILAFYTVPEYEAWERNNADIASKYRVNYYKGLGTHSAAQTKHMFSTFYEHIHTYYADERSAELVKIYCGDEPELRKRVLSQAPRQPPRELIIKQAETRRISVSNHLEYDTDEYQRDNLDRKLDHAIDGQNQAGRKILDGLLKYCSHVNLTRVEKVSGPISEHENYHHGGASLMDSIQKRAFVAVGGNQLPILCPESQLGNRMCGGKEAAAPRYTDVLLNKRLTDALFPPIDYYMLQFLFDEGKRGEPKYFVPLLPLAICEFSNLPAHGWALNTWARDVFAVIANVRILIATGDLTPMLTMPVACRSGKYEYKGEFRNIRGKPYSVGRYHVVTAGPTTCIRITELPLRTWTLKYLEDIRKKAAKHPELIVSVDSGKSDDVIVDITVELAPGALDRIMDLGDSCFTDGVEEFLLLRDHMKSHINLMGPDNTVIEYTSYGDVIHTWFAKRKEFFGLRIDRQLEILRLKKIMMANIIRYTEQVQSLNLPGKTEAEMIEILTDHNFDRVASGILNAPLFTPTADLDRVVLHSGKSKYKYLLGMSELKKTAERMRKYRETADKLNQEVIDLEELAARGRFRGAVLFTQELDNLEKIITEGLRTDWKFEQFGKNTL